MASQHSNEGRFYRVIIFIMAAILIVMGMAIFILRTPYLLENAAAADDINTSEELTPEQAGTVLERANDAVNSAQLVLSFLEGASVLAAIALGAAAIYGVRSNDQLRADMEEEIKKVQDFQNQSQQLLAELRAYRDQLRELPATVNRIGDIEENLQTRLAEIDIALAEAAQTPIMFTELLQANQELNLRNYHEAYAIAVSVLKNSPDNPQALYIAGWLEVQHISGKLDDGIAHLHQGMQKANWPILKAAYGVALRRKAMSVEGDKRIELFEDAIYHLRKALRESPNLTDFNQESFWGVIGGVLRDMGRLDEAIKAYESALRVTPDSSYPLGNLATLYLSKAHEGDGWKQKALRAFEEARRAAQAELIAAPYDYYLVMDIAMSSAMMSAENPDHIEESRRRLEAGLKLQPTPNVLEVSLRGWQRLLKDCPEDWQNVRTHIETTIQRFKETLETARQQDSAVAEVAEAS